MSFNQAYTELLVMLPASVIHEAWIRLTTRKCSPLSVSDASGVNSMVELFLKHETLHGLYIGNFNCTWLCMGFTWDFFTAHGFFHKKCWLSTAKILRCALCTERGIEKTCPFTFALNSPFTTGSQPARYCHCVPSISNDLSLPFRSFSVGITENSSDIVTVFVPSPIVIGISLIVPRVLVDPATPLSACTFFRSILRPRCLATFSEITEESDPVSITQVEGAPLSKIQKMQISHFSGKWWEIVENATLR
ncbi:hypothetical protein RhiirC2_857983 [Rhizophagus irregularis]|uniref:Uncharacterized protein n=1 Tax=Rhizophagus irregularis TaxID=588596 RepID=A0A2N1M8Q2_9GLOM|nr:hypothetical protein RhiirC2_857983 [Rhizophagus irregularis]